MSPISKSWPPFLPQNPSTLSDLVYFSYRFMSLFLTVVIICVSSIILFLEIEQIYIVSLSYPW